MPRDGKETPLPPNFVQRAVEGIRYIISGVTPTTWFGPAQPLQPMAPLEVAGRQFDYPVGYNLVVTPRADEGVSFAQLRSLADSYDLLRLVIETRKDQMERLDWTIRRRALTDGRPVDRDDDPRIGAIETFFRMPDRVHFWSTWLRQLLEDLFVIDAPTLYLRRSRNGQLYALEPVDGSTIKRLIDIDGRTPTPPDPAYQQVLHGVPAVDYTTQELIYRPRNARTHKLYGFSPVEQIVMTVNVALRRQLHQLAYYTEGNVPEALIGTPESWTPTQIKEFQQYWDALLEGNLAQRRHAKFVPGGVAKTFIPTKETELKSAFDEWLARVVCFAFSISPQPFTDHINRATAETAQAAALAEGLAPIQSWVKQLVDYLLITEFDAADLEFAWRDEREIDAQKLAGIAQIYVTHGIKTVNEARAEIGLDPVEGGDTPMVFTGTGAVPLAQAANGGDAPAGGAAAKALAKYSPDQPRDERGRWTSEGAAPSALRPVSDRRENGDAREAQLPPFLARPPILPRVPRVPGGRAPGGRAPGGGGAGSDLPPDWPNNIGRPMRPRSGQSGDEGAKDAPSWARGRPPGEKETPPDYGNRLMDEKYPNEDWRANPRRMDEFRKIKKYYRHWRKPAQPPLDPNVPHDDDGA
jgi:hypothetical protein